MVNKSFQNYIKRLIEHLQPRMHLLEYDVKLKYVDKISQVPNLRYVPGTAEGYTAEVQIDLVYLELLISISKVSYKKYQRGQLRDVALTIVHELAHTYTEEMHNALEDKMKTKVEREWLRKVNENATEKIARAIFDQMPRDLWNKK